jgi:hypothetical protein
MAVSGRRMMLEVFGVVFALWVFARWLRVPQMMACRKVRVRVWVCVFASSSEGREGRG